MSRGVAREGRTKSPPERSLDVELDAMPSPDGSATTSAAAVQLRVA